MISNLARLAIVMVTTCSASAATAQAFDAIVVRFRPPYGVCAGVCPNFETEILAEGYVRTRSFSSEQVYYFDAKPRDLQRFAELMEELRPSEDRKIDEACERATLEGGSPDPLSWPRGDDIEVRWYTPTGFIRLTACAGDEQLRTTLQDALRALGADPYSGAQAREDF